LDHLGDLPRSCLIHTAKFARRRTIQDYSVNDEIRAKTVRLVDNHGEQLGIMPLAEALEKASERELDLVEVAESAKPPVCKLMDYGKFKYRQKKKRQHQKSHRSRLKEIRIGLNTDDHDLKVKADRVTGFLKDHDKVQVTMRLRGREKAHGDLALENMADFAERFEEVAQIERGPERTGAGQISLLLKPK
jgi:translation initiation factor IF-3